MSRYDWEARDNAKCMFCGKAQVKRLEMWDEDEFPIANTGSGTINHPDAEWYFCKEHGEKIRRGLGLFFADLQLKNDEGLK